MTPQEIAAEVSKIFDNNPNRRTVGAQARTAQGISCEPNSKSACSWCFVGAAIKAASKEKEREAFYRACIPFLNERYLRQGSLAGNVAAFSDGSTFEQVIELLAEVSAI